MTSPVPSSPEPAAPHGTAKPPDPTGRPATSTEPEDFLPRGDQIERRTARGTGLSLAAQILRLVLTVTSAAILGRLLTPSDFGIVGMALAFVSIVETFRDAGLSLATVQHNRLTHAQVSTLFWINLVVSVVLCGVLIACAPLLVRFYGDERVGPVVIALSLLFIPAGATVQHLATLRRQLRFGWIAALDIGTQLAITTVSVLLAIYGFSYWSLVAGTTAGAFTGLVIAWWGSGWAPRLPRRGTGIRPLLRFGGYTAASNFLYVISKDLDKMLLGRVWGTDAVGVYSRAHQLTMLPTYTFSGAIGRSVLPGMAGSVESPEEFRRVYLTNTSLLAILAMPTAALCLVAADFIVPLLLGQQWLEAIPVFRALAVAALAHPIASTNAWLYGSLGRGLANLVWIAANVPLLILSIVIGIKWGPIGVAISYSVYLLVTVLPCMIFALRGTPVRLIDLWPVARTPILLSIAVGAGGAVPLLSAASFSPLVGTMVATFCGGLAALAVAVVLPSARRDAIDALGALGIFRGLRRFRPPLPG